MRSEKWQHEQRTGEYYITKQGIIGAGNLYREPKKPIIAGLSGFRADLRGKSQASKGKRGWLE